MKRRHIALLAVALIGSVVGSGASPAAAGTGPTDRPCGGLTFDYGLPHLEPGVATDMDMSITNCSSHTERLRLHVRSSGPCAFAHPAAHTYRLTANSGFGMSALFITPSCPGRYSVHLRLTLKKSRIVLDAANDGFVIEKQAG